MGLVWETWPRVQLTESAARHAAPLPGSMTLLADIICDKADEADKEKKKPGASIP
jgi:hypothetical protein